jgi:hypothetical protein
VGVGVRVCLEGRGQGEVVRVRACGRGGWVEGGSGGPLRGEATWAHLRKARAAMPDDRAQPGSMLTGGSPLGSGVERQDAGEGAGPRGVGE